MTPGSADPAPRRAAFALTLAGVGLVSAALICYEVVLMRRLLIERWHHFGYLVISTALLGFGASGTLLAVLGGVVRRHPARTLFWLAVGLVLALLGAPRLAALLPVTAHFLPGDLWWQGGWWTFYWVLALLPFLVGGALLGAALMTAGPNVGRVYAANLFGSGVGAAAAILAAARLMPAQGDWPPVVLTSLAVAALAWPTGRRSTLLVTLLIAGAVVAVEIRWPARLAYDQFKYAARLELLAEQRAAQRVAAAADPHGYVELHESDLFHDLPFLALRRSPPPMFSLTINGDPAGSVLRIADADEAAVMDDTLMALPYRLIPARPRVLLIGETGGANIWLARRQSAGRIDAVQPNAAVVELLRAHSPRLLDYPGLEFSTREARRFLATHDEQRYDLIQLVTLEGLGGAGGMHGLAEDHLVTVEGLAECLAALTDAGVLAVSRGIQQPARENIRLLATLAAALEHLGVADPAEHLVQVRDYLGVCTLALRTPLTPTRREVLRTAIRELGLTPVWYGGLPIAEVNRPDEMAGPPGTTVDWLHYAAGEILSPRRAAFFDAWLLNVRPPRDDSPFFWDFHKRGAIAALKHAYGELWLTRAELGRLFLYTSLAVSATAALLLILAPLAIAGTVLRIRRARGPDRREPGSGTATLATIAYFAAIGLGFMGIEMALISRAIRWLGDPVLASAVVIGGVLIVSGIGSLTSRRITRGRLWLAPLLIVLAAVLLRLVGWAAPAGGLLGAGPLLAVALPTAYFMGMPLPTGVAALNERYPRLVPWAWGVNGLASVVATSAAIAIAMTGGYRTVMLLAAGAYALAAAVGFGLRRRPDAAVSA